MYVYMSINFLPVIIITTNSHYYNLAVVLSGTELWNDSIIGSHDMEGTYGTHW